MTFTTNNPYGLPDLQQGHADVRFWTHRQPQNELDFNHYWEASDLQADAREFADAVDAFRTKALTIIERASRRTSDIDAADESKAVNDYLTDLAGETFDNWNEYADRMKREAVGGR